MALNGEMATMERFCTVEKLLIKISFNRNNGKQGAGSTLPYNHPLGTEMDQEIRWAAVVDEKRRNLNCKALQDSRHALCFSIIKLGLVPFSTISRLRFLPPPL